MRGRSLVRWVGLEEARRKKNDGGLLRQSGTVLSVVVGVGLSLEIARQFMMKPDTALLSTSHLWMVIAGCAYVLGVFMAPFRLYWRHDSKLLASLAVPGRSLFVLTLWASHRWALQVTFALLLGLLSIGVWSSSGVFFRHLPILLLGVVGSAWLGPAAALAAGAIVASAKAQAMVASIGGDFQAPKTSWLGILPGLAATSLTLAFVASAPWVLETGPVAGGSMVVIVATVVGVCVVSLIWAWRCSADVLPNALREVAALDQEILAHIDRSTPSTLERIFFGVVLPSRRARLLADKDVSLSRRRYPSPYFVIPCGIAALWIVAFTGPTNYFSWGSGILGILLVYSLLMVRRSNRPPVEIALLLRNLPISLRETQWAKFCQAFLRTAVILLFGGVPVVLGSTHVASAALYLALATGVHLVATLWILKTPE